MGLFRKSANAASASPTRQPISPLAVAADRSRADAHWRWVEPGLRAMRDGDAPAHIRAAAELLTELKRSTKKRSLSVLDVGCHSAYLSEVLRHYLPGWCWYVGVEESPAMRGLAREHFPDVILANMDASRLSFESGSFDLVFCASLTDRGSEWREVLAELCRIARGWILLHRFRSVTDGPTAEYPHESGPRLWVGEGELLAATNTGGFRRVKTLVSGDGRGLPGRESNTYLFERLSRAAGAGT
jgi:SAM-dependent methyltransferase